MSARPLPRGITITRDQTIQIDFSIRGRRFRERLPVPPTRAHLAFAAQKRMAILYDIARGTFRYSEHFPDSPRARSGPGRAVPTVREALCAFLRQRRRVLADSTLRDYRSLIYRHIIPALGPRRLDEVSVAALRDWLAELPLSPGRLRALLTPLRAVFADAVADELLADSPLAHIHLPGRAGSGTPEPDPLTPAELRSLLNHCEERSFARFIAFAAGSGLRTSELIALAWTDVDLERGVVHVRRAVVRGKSKVPKTSAGVRTVRLMPLALSAIAEERAAAGGGDGAVWRHPRSGAAYRNGQAIRRRWRRACIRAGVRYRPPYQTRHTYASWLLSSGEEPAWIARQLGHANCAMVRRVYARWVPEARPDAGRRAARLFMRALLPAERQVSA